MYKAGNKSNESIKVEIIAVKSMISYFVMLVQISKQNYPLSSPRPHSLTSAGVLHVVYRA
jgi:hypothetical protein